MSEDRITVEVSNFHVHFPNLQATVTVWRDGRAEIINRSWTQDHDLDAAACAAARAHAAELRYVVSK